MRLSLLGIILLLAACTQQPLEVFEDYSKACSISFEKAVKPAESLPLVEPESTPEPVDEPTPIKLRDITVNETGLVVLGINITDMGDVSYTYSEPLDENGMWQTDYDSAGSYPITVTADNGTHTAIMEFTLYVKNVNRAPAFRTTTLK